MTYLKEQFGTIIFNNAWLIDLGLITGAAVLLYQGFRGIQGKSMYILLMGSPYKIAQNSVKPIGYGFIFTSLFFFDNHLRKNIFHI